MDGPLRTNRATTDDTAMTGGDIFAVALEVLRAYVRGDTAYIEAVARGEYGTEMLFGLLEACWRGWQFECAVARLGPPLEVLDRRLAELRLQLVAAAVTNGDGC